MARPKRLELLTPRFVVWRSERWFVATALQMRSWPTNSPRAYSSPGSALQKCKVWLAAQEGRRRARRAGQLDGSHLMPLAGLERRTVTRPITLLASAD